MNQSRGYIMIELTFALSMLVVVIGAASMVIINGNREQMLLWEEFQAGELAHSALEHALARDADLKMSPDECVTLPDAALKIVRIPIEDQPGLESVRTTVTWSNALNALPRKVERTVRRRIEP
jgi:type II secretory pathway pseudopilin PulG